MPDPRDHDEGYTRVRSHYRRKPTAGGGGDNEQIGCALMALFAAGVIAVVCVVVWHITLELARTWYYWLGPLLVIIGVIVFLLLKLSKKHPSERRRGIKRVLDASFTGCLVIPIAGMLVASIYFFVTRHTEGHLIAGVCTLIATVFLSVVAIKKKHEYDHDVRQQDAKVELDTHIQTALGEMKSLGVSYALEENANQQLALILRGLMPGVDIQLLPPSAGAGDIRVGNTIIEGKLDLEDNNEMNRLIGQLHSYCSNTSDLIRVVVYGRLRSDFQQRIEGLPEYPDRILLHHIEGIRTKETL
jgi:hypothetical protein